MNRCLQGCCNCPRFMRGIDDASDEVYYFVSSGFTWVVGGDLVRASPDNTNALVDNYKSVNNAKGKHIQGVDLIIFLSIRHRCLSHQGKSAYCDLGSLDQRALSNACHFNGIFNWPFSDFVTPSSLDSAIVNCPPLCAVAQSHLSFET